MQQRVQYSQLAFYGVCRLGRRACSTNRELVVEIGGHWGNHQDTFEASGPHLLEGIRAPDLYIEANVPAEHLDQVFVDQGLSDIPGVVAGMSCQATTSLNGFQDHSKRYCTINKRASWMRRSHGTTHSKTSS